MRITPLLPLTIVLGMLAAVSIPGGAQGPAVVGWIAYRDYTFEPGSETIAYVDAPKAGEVARHLRRNPGFRVGLDGHSARRVANVRGALIEAGVPAEKIEAGPVGDPNLRRDWRVTVLVGN